MVFRVSTEVRNFAVAMEKKTIISIVPFGIFVVSAIGLSFAGAVDINLLVGIGILAILIGAFLTKDTESYWNILFCISFLRFVCHQYRFWVRNNQCHEPHPFPCRHSIGC